MAIDIVVSSNKNVIDVNLTNNPAVNINTIERGPAGSSGTSGSSGISGTSGLSGSSGTSGSSGSSGTTGATGSSGTSGIDGSSLSDSLSKTFYQSSHDFSVGNVLRYDGSLFYKALADSPENAEVIGLVQKIIDPNSFKLGFNGYMTGFSGLIPGNVYFLSDTNSGSYTNVQPTGLGTISKPIFIAIDSVSATYLNYRGIENSTVGYSIPVPTISGSYLKFDGVNIYWSP